MDKVTLLNGLCAPLNAEQQSHKLGYLALAEFLANGGRMIFPFPFPEIV
jgi:hypothetical protein